MAEEKKTPQQLLDEAVAKGGVLAVFYFDISTNEKEAVQEMLAQLVGKVSAEPGIVSCVGEIEEPIRMDELWVSSAEVTLLAKNFDCLAAVAIRYGPVGVEVLKPDEIKMSLGQAQRMLLNISQVAQDYANYIISKTMSEEEKEAFKKRLAARAEVGKKILEKKEEKK